MTDAPVPARAVARTGYLIGLLLIILPLVDTVPVLFRPHVADVRWRFGVEGIMSGALMTPLFGVFVLMAAAAVLDHRRILRLLAALSGVAALCLVAAAVLFALDMGQVLHAAPPAGRGDISSASLKALTKMVLSAMVAAGYTAVVWRASRAERTPAALEASMLVGTGRSG